VVIRGLKSNKSLFYWRSREESENYVLSRGLPIFIGTIPPLKHNAFFRVWQPLSPRVRAPWVYGDLNFVTDLAQQFSLSVVGPSRPVAVPLRVARAGRRGLSFPPKADMPDMVSGIRISQGVGRRVGHPHRSNGSNAIFTTTHARTRVTHARGLGSGSLRPLRFRLARAGRRGFFDPRSFLP
jgi:hypothetical protein